VLLQLLYFGSLAAILLCKSEKSKTGSLWSYITPHLSQRRYNAGSDARPTTTCWI